MQENMATTPFRFMSRVSLPELTGIAATNLAELLQGIKSAPPGAIFNHTHNFQPAQQSTALELVSDFAFWVRETLMEEVLGERLALLNPGHFHHIEELRAALVRTVEAFLAGNDRRSTHAVPSGREFHFIKANIFVFPLSCEVTDLPGFARALKTVSLNSIFYHAFESKLRHEQTENDFVRWVRDSVGDADLARTLHRMDLYSYSLSSVPVVLARTVEERMFLGRLYQEG